MNNPSKQTKAVKLYLLLSVLQHISFFIRTWSQKQSWYCTWYYF